MKGSLIIALLLLTASYSFAQNTAWPGPTDNSNVGIGTTNPAQYSKLDLQGGGLNIGGSGNADAALHIKSSYGGFDRLTQLNPSAPGKPGLNLVASTDAQGNYQWWSWGVLTNGNYAFQPGIQFYGYTGIFMDRQGRLGISMPNPQYALDVNGGAQFANAINVNGASSSSYSGINNINAFQNGGIHINGNIPNVAQDAVTYTSGGGGGAALAFGRGSSYDTFLSFYVNDQNTHAWGATREVMRIQSQGNLLIGKTTQTNVSYKLDVAGAARMDKVVVNTSGADFVFNNSYNLRQLAKVENYIRANHHLPEVPSATQMQSQGMDVGELNKRLLQKVEELTLYLIEKDHQLKAEQYKNRNQDKRIKILEEKLLHSYTFSSRPKAF